MGSSIVGAGVVRHNRALCNGLGVAIFSIGMRRAESTATVHSVDVSLQSSPMLRSSREAGIQRCGSPLWGTNGQSAALDFSGTFFRLRLWFEHSQSYYASPHPGGAGDPFGDHLRRDADRF